MKTNRAFLFLAAGLVIGLVVGCKNGAAGSAAGEGNVVVAQTRMAEESANGRLVAWMGFNVGAGMGVDGKGSFYEFGGVMPRVGRNNPDDGWADGWDGATDSMKIEKDSPYEGDGCARLAPGSGEMYVVRSLKEPLKGRVVIELAVRAEADTWLASRPGLGQENCGPMWGIEGGRFWALDGNGSGDGNLRKRGDFEVVVGKWYVVTLTIDTAGRTYRMAVDGKLMLGGKALGFRSNSCDAIGSIDFLCRKPAWVDAVRIWVK